MNDSMMDIAMKTSENLGRFSGAVGWVLKHGDLNDNDFRSLATTYIQVNDGKEFNAEDVSIIRAEASRRGIDVG